MVVAHQITLCYKMSLIGFEWYHFNPDMMNMVALFDKHGSVGLSVSLVSVDTS